MNNALLLQPAGSALSPRTQSTMDQIRVLQPPIQRDPPAVLTYNPARLKAGKLELYLLVPFLSELEFRRVCIWDLSFSVDWEKSGYVDIYAAGQRFSWPATLCFDIQQRTVRRMPDEELILFPG